MRQKPADCLVKFEAGEIVITPAASLALEANGRSVDDLLTRHQAGDWGNVSDQIRRVNERGLVEGFGLRSTYLLDTGDRVVMVTNADRNLTMVHLDACAT
jgi:hypothetical protein